MLSLYLSMLETDEEKAEFANIYEAYRSACLHVALKITHNQEMAEDALHNAFIALIRHKEKYLSFPCNKLRSQIVIIVKNKAIDLMRGESHTIAPSVEDLNIETGFDISEYVTDDDSFKRLTEHISQLPEQYRTVFQLRYFHDLNNKEIAEKLGETPQSIAVKIHRAKKILKESLTREGEYVG